MITFPFDCFMVEVVDQLELEVVINCQQTEVDTEDWQLPILLWILEVFI